MPILETVIILPLVLGIDLQIQPSQSSLSLDFETSIANSGNLTGNHDSESNPDGTITIPGLWGGSGNQEIPIDFHGGLLDKHTRLVHFGDRVYDPVLGQWMTPDWEKLGKDLHSPFDVFTYRFMNNNPMNRDQDLVRFKGNPII